MKTTTASLFVGAALLLAAPLPAQQAKLNGPLARPVGGDIFSYTLSADGASIVYTADQDQDDVIELYALARAGGAPVKLNGPLVSGGDVLSSFEPLTTATGRVIYLADSEVDGQDELFSVALAGGTPVKLNGPLAPGADVLSDNLPGGRFVRLSPDETRVLFAVQVSNPIGELELYSVPVEGGVPVRLDRIGWDSPDYTISSDSRHVVMFERSRTRTEIVRVPLAGRGLVRLSPEVTGTEEIGSGFALDPTATRVFFGARLGSATRFELYSAPLDASTPAIPLAPGRSMFAPVPSPDGAWVVFRSENELFSVSADGSEEPRSLVTLPPGRRLDYLRITPTSDAVLFRSDLAVQGDFEFLRVPIDGSAGAVSLTPGNVLETPRDEPELSPDGTRLLYLASEPVRALYTVPVDGSLPPLFVTRITRTAEAYSFALDGTYVVFLANEDTQDELELFSVPTFGGTPRQLNPTLTFGGDVLPSGGVNRGLRISADGSWVVFLADGSVDELYELFCAQVDGSQPAACLSPELATGPVLGDVGEYAVTTDGTRAVYLARQEGSDSTELYSVSLAARRAPVRLNVDLPPGRSVAQFALSPDGSRVAYRVEFQQFSTPDEFYSVPTEGGPSLRLATRPGAYPPILFVVPDGTRLVFSASSGGGSQKALFVVPLDASEPALQLTPFFSSLGSVELVETRLVYLGESSSGNARLYSVPLDGSQAPVELNGPLVNRGKVQSFAPSEDGTRIVYTASELVRDRFDLFVVPTDGSSGRIVLAQPRLHPASVTQFETRGDHALFLADLEQRGRRDLFRVPLDGSQAPTRLNAPLATRREVRDFRIAPDGTRVAYRADPVVEGHFELFSVAVAGGSPVKLSGPRVAGAVGGGSLYEDDRIEPFVISPDSSLVLFRADLGGGTVGLFSTPMDGGALPIPLVPTARGDVVLSGLRFTPDGSVIGRAVLASGATFLFQARVDEARSARRVSGFGSFHGLEAPFSFALLPVAERLVFRHDQESRGVYELFLGFIPREAGRSASVQPPTHTVRRDL